MSINGMVAFSAVWRDLSSSSLVLEALVSLIMAGSW